MGKSTKRELWAEKQLEVIVGYFREDGNIRILAAHNNIDEEIDPDEFKELVTNTVAFYEQIIDGDIKVWQRQETEHYLTYDAETAAIDFIELEVERD